MTFSEISTKFRWSRIHSWVLAGSWVLGMSFGYFCAHGAQDILVPLVRQCADTRCSAIGLLSAALLPFLLSALAVSFSERWLLLLFSGFKAFSFTFCASGVGLAYGQSSWLVRCLLLFSDLCLIPVLYIYWLRQLKETGKPRPWELPCCLAWAFLVCGVDYLFIAPFLASIMERR